MRAAILEKVGEPIQIYDDVEIIEPRAGEIRVTVKYCGLCNSDFAILSGKFPVEEPIIVGHEASGIIESVGEGVSHFAPGDSVVLTPVPPCGICYYCQRGQHSLCVNGMSMATMALPDGETGLRHRGRRILHGVGVAALARSGGTIVCVGAPPLEDKVTLNNVVMFAIMEKKLCGCLLGSSKALRDIRRLIRLSQAGRLDLDSMITARRPLEEINEGFADLQAGRGIQTVIEM